MKKILLFCFAWLFFALTGCVSSERGPASRCAEIQAFLKGDLETYQNRVDAAAKAYQEEQWRVETADPKASPQTLSRLFAESQQAIYQRDILEKAKALDMGLRGVASLSGCAPEESFHRAVGILESTILLDDKVIAAEKRNQDLQNAMIEKSNSFRMKIPGHSEPDSKAIYAKELGSLSDRKAREALFKRFNAQRAGQWLKWGFRELIEKRNEEAKLAGFSHYVEYRFFRNQLDYGNYREMVAELKANLAPKIKRELERMGKEKKIDHLAAFDLRFLRDQAATGKIDKLLAESPEAIGLDIARKFYSELGFDVEKYGFPMDLYPRPGKNTHAFAMSIVFPRVDKNLSVLPEPKADIRFLANLKKPVKWTDISTVIHELGHAIHAAEVRQPIGLFRGIGSVGTEAIAMTMERMAGHPDFIGSALQEKAHSPASDTLLAMKDRLQAVKREQAFSLLRQVFFSDFENEMYRNPKGDFPALWAKMHKEYWGVEIAEKNADWDVEHFLMAPVYVQNYAIGILMVEQLYASLNSEFSGQPRSPAAGEKLRQFYFAPGDEFSYLDLTSHFSGEPLSVRSALRLLD